MIDAVIWWTGLLVYAMAGWVGLMMLLALAIEMSLKQMRLTKAFMVWAIQTARRKNAKAR